jgi:hypothetical protein
LREGVNRNEAIKKRRDIELMSNGSIHYASKAKDLILAAPQYIDSYYSTGVLRAPSAAGSSRKSNAKIRAAGQTNSAQ